MSLVMYWWCFIPMQEYKQLFEGAGTNPGDKTLEDKFFEHEVCFVYICLFVCLFCFVVVVLGLFSCFVLCLYNLWLLSASFECNAIIHHGRSSFGLPCRMWMSNKVSQTCHSFLRWKHKCPLQDQLTYHVLTAQCGAQYECHYEMATQRDIK